MTKKSSEKSNAPHMPGVPPLGLNIDRCIKIYAFSNIRLKADFHCRAIFMWVGTCVNKIEAIYGG